MRAEHILPTGNHPRTWRNTLCRPEIDPRRGGTHSAGRKSTRDVVEQTLPTGNHPRTWRNTLWRPEIDPGLGGTHSADRKSSQDKRKLTWDVAEHTLLTGNQPGHGGTHSADRKLTRTWRNTLCRPQINPRRGSIMMYEYRAGRAKRGSCEY